MGKIAILVYYVMWSYIMMEHCPV